MAQAAKKNTPHGSAKERILITAYDLFYTQGFQSTGVNQIIEETGVSKATFYANYKSKEALGLAYLEERDRRETELVGKILHKYSTPREQFIGIVKELKAWMEDTKYRGCGFANMASEVIDHSSPMRAVVTHHYDAFRKLAKDLIIQMKDEDPEKYSHIDEDHVSDLYFIIIEGAIIASQCYGEIWPFENAIRAARELLDHL